MFEQALKNIDGALHRDAGSATEQSSQPC